jgi:hypothetical protein
MKAVYLGAAMILSAYNVCAQEFGALQNASFLGIASSANNNEEIAIAEAVLVSEKSSTNKVDNPDGSTTVVGPLFESRPISSQQSDHTAVCRLFGLNSYVTHTMKKLRHPKTLAAINTEGALSSSPYAFEVYDALVCTDGRPARASTQYAKISDIGGGLKRILKPRFDYDGTPTQLSYIGSRAAGVCRLFGFNSLEASTWEIVFPTHHPVMDSSGKLLEFKINATVYKTIDCR